MSYDDDYDYQEPEYEYDQGDDEGDYEEPSSDYEEPGYDYEEPYRQGADEVYWQDDRVAQDRNGPAWDVTPGYESQPQSDDDWEAAFFAAGSAPTQNVYQNGYQPGYGEAYDPTYPGGTYSRDVYEATYGGDLPGDAHVGAAAAPGGRGAVVTTWADGTPMDEKAAKQAQIYQVGLEEGLDDEGARVLVAVTETEGGLFGAVGDTTKNPLGSRGPFQFYEGGQMPAFRTWLQQNNIPGDPNVLVNDPDIATRFAARNYLGATIKKGQAAGLHDSALATYTQRYGQVSVDPDRTGSNYQRLFAQGDPYGEALRFAHPDAGSRQRANQQIPPGHTDGDGHDHGVATPYTQQQVDKAGNTWTVAFDYGQPYDQPFNPDIPVHRGVDLQPTGVDKGGMNLPYTPFRSGRVAEITTDEHGGIGIIVDTGDPNARYDRYFHNNAVSVSKGDLVTAGQTPLGLIGQTGSIGFPHLHYEVSQNINGDPVGKTIDPRQFISWTSAPPGPGRVVPSTTAAAPPVQAPPVQELVTPYTSGRRAQTTGVVIHSTRGDSATPEEEFEWTKRWFGQNPYQVSANAVIGPDGTIAMPKDWDLVTHHAGENNRTMFGIELVQPRPEDPYSDAQYRSLQWLLGQVSSRYNLPLNRQTVVGHEELDQGKRSNKTDPGANFDWGRALQPAQAPQPAQPAQPAQAPGPRSVFIPAGRPGTTGANGVPGQPDAQGNTYTVGGRPATRGQYEAAAAEQAKNRQDFLDKLPDPTRQAYTEWEAWRKSRGEDPGDMTEFQAHLGRLGAPNPFLPKYTVGGREVSQEEYTQAQVAAAKERQDFLDKLPDPTRRAYVEWEAFRKARGESPADIDEFRAHIDRLGVQNPWREAEAARAQAQAQAAAAPRPGAPPPAAPGAGTRTVYTLGNREVSYEEYAAAKARQDAFNASVASEQAALDAYNRAYPDWARRRDAFTRDTSDRIPDPGPEPTAPATPNLSLQLQGRAPEHTGAYTQQIQRPAQEQAALDQYNRDYPIWRQRADAGFDLANLGPQPMPPTTLTLNAALEGRAPEHLGAVTAQQTRRRLELQQQTGISGTDAQIREGLSLAAEDTFNLRDQQLGQAAAARSLSDPRPTSGPLGTTERPPLPPSPVEALSAQQARDRQTPFAAERRANDAAREAGTELPYPEVEAVLNEQRQAEAEGRPIPTLGELRPDTHPRWTHVLDNVPIIGQGVNQLVDMITNPEARRQYIDDTWNQTFYGGVAQPITRGAQFIGELMEAQGRGSPLPGSATVSQWGRDLSWHAHEMADRYAVDQLTLQQRGINTIRPPDQPFSFVNPSDYVQSLAVNTPILAMGILTGFAATGAAAVLGASAGAATLAGFGATFLTMFPTEGGQTYSDLRAMGVNRDDALKGGMVVGAINAVIESYGPADWMAPALRPLVKTALGRTVGRTLTQTPVLSMLTRMAEHGFSEGSEEVPQGLTGNLIKYLYDSNQDLFEGLAEAFAGGAVAGAALGSTQGAAHAGAKMGSQTEITPATILAQDGLRVVSIANDWQRLVVQRTTPDGLVTYLSVGPSANGQLASVPISIEQVPESTGRIDTPEQLQQARQGVGQTLQHLTDEGLLAPGRGALSYALFGRAAADSLSISQNGMSKVQQAVASRAPAEPTEAEDTLYGLDAGPILAASLAPRTPESGPRLPAWSAVSETPGEILTKEGFEIEPVDGNFTTFAVKEQTLDRRQQREYTLTVIPDANDTTGYRVQVTPGPFAGQVVQPNLRTEQDITAGTARLGRALGDLQSRGVLSNTAVRSAVDSFSQIARTALADNQVRPSVVPSLKQAIGVDPTQPYAHVRPERWDNYGVVPGAGLTMYAASHISRQRMAEIMANPLTAVAGRAWMEAVDRLDAWRARLGLAAPGTAPRRAALATYGAGLVAQSEGDDAQRHPDTGVGPKFPVSFDPGFAILEAHLEAEVDGIKPGHPLYAGRLASKVILAAVHEPAHDFSKLHGDAHTNAMNAFMTLLDAEVAGLTPVMAEMTAQGHTAALVETHLRAYAQGSLSPGWKANAAARVRQINADRAAGARAQGNNVVVAGRPGVESGTGTGSAAPGVLPRVRGERGVSTGGGVAGGVTAAPGRPGAPRPRTELPRLVRGPNGGVVSAEQLRPAPTAIPGKTPPTAPGQAPSPMEGQQPPEIVRQAAAPQRPAGNVDIPDEVLDRLGIAPVSPRMPPGRRPLADRFAVPQGPNGLRPGEPVTRPIEELRRDEIPESEVLRTVLDRWLANTGRARSPLNLALREYWHNFRHLTPTSETRWVEMPSGRAVYTNETYGEPDETLEAYATSPFFQGLDQVTADMFRDMERTVGRGSGASPTRYNGFFLDNAFLGARLQGEGPTLLFGTQSPGQVFINPPTALREAANIWEAANGSLLMTDAGLEFAARFYVGVVAHETAHSLDPVGERHIVGGRDYGRDPHGPAHSKLMERIYTDRGAPYVQRITDLLKAARDDGTLDQVLPDLVPNDGNWYRVPPRADGWPEVGLGMDYRTGHLVPVPLEQSLTAGDRVLSGRVAGELGYAPDPLGGEGAQLPQAPGEAVLPDQRRGAPVVQFQPEPPAPSAMTGQAPPTVDGIPVDPHWGPVEPDRRAANGVSYVPLDPEAAAQLQAPLVYQGEPTVTDKARALARLVVAPPEHGVALVGMIQNALGNQGPTTENVRSLLGVLGSSNVDQAPLLVKAAEGNTGIQQGGLADLIITHMLASAGMAQGYDGLIVQDSTTNEVVDAAAFVPYHGADLGGGYVTQDGRPVWRGADRPGYQVEDGRPIWQGQQPPAAGGYRVVDGRPVWEDAVPSAMEGQEPPNIAEPQTEYYAPAIYEQDTRIHPDLAIQPYGFETDAALDQLLLQNDARLNRGEVRRLTRAATGDPRRSHDYFYSGSSAALSNGHRIIGGGDVPRDVVERAARRQSYVTMDKALGDAYRRLQDQALARGLIKNRGEYSGLTFSHDVGGYNLGAGSNSVYLGLWSAVLSTERGNNVALRDLLVGTIAHELAHNEFSAHDEDHLRKTLELADLAHELNLSNQLRQPVNQWQRQGGWNDAIRDSGAAYGITRRGIQPTTSQMVERAKAERTRAIAEARARSDIESPYRQRLAAQWQLDPNAADLPEQLEEIGDLIALGFLDEHANGDVGAARAARDAMTRDERIAKRRVFAHGLIRDMRQGGSNENSIFDALQDYGYPIEEIGGLFNDPEVLEPPPSEEGPSAMAGQEPPEVAALRADLEHPELLTDIAQRANGILDGWEQDEDGYDDVFGAGGICDAISNEIMAAIQERYGDIGVMDGGQDGDDHAYPLAYRDGAAFVVDIPSSVYETGSGYTWTKIPGAEIRPEHIVLEEIPYEYLGVEDEDEVTPSAMASPPPPDLPRGGIQDYHLIAAHVRVGRALPEHLHAMVQDRVVEVWKTGDPEPTFISIPHYVPPNDEPWIPLQPQDPGATGSYRRRAYNAAIRAYGGRTDYPNGFYTSLPSEDVPLERDVSFDSPLELVLMLKLDGRIGDREIDGKKVKNWWRADDPNLPERLKPFQRMDYGTGYEYVPDFIVEYEDNPIEVWEVKPAEHFYKPRSTRLGSDPVTKSVDAIPFITGEGAGYRIWTEAEIAPFIPMGRTPRNPDKDMPTVAGIDGVDWRDVPRLNAGLSEVPRKPNKEVHRNGLEIISMLNQAQRDVLSGSAGDPVLFMNRVRDEISRYRDGHDAGLISGDGQPVAAPVRAPRLPSRQQLLVDALRGSEKNLTQNELRGRTGLSIHAISLSLNGGQEVTGLIDKGLAEVHPGHPLTYSLKGQRATNPLAALSRQQRQVYDLLVQGDRSPTEIHDQTGIPKPRVSHVLTSLSNHMVPSEDDPTVSRPLIERRRRTRHRSEWGIVGTALTDQVPSAMTGQEPGAIWEPLPQEYSSKSTSLNQRPELFTKVPWREGDVNFDLGAGRSEKGTEYLAAKGVTNLRYDPQWRTPEENAEALRQAQAGGGVDTVTVANVLNVIAEPEVRAQVINQAADVLKPGGTAYFSVYENQKDGVGRQTGQDRWQNNRRTTDYLNEVRQVFPNAEARNGIISAPKPSGVAPSAMVGAEIARDLPYEVDLPSSPEFIAAVRNTPGAAVTPDGLELDYVRYQQPEQEDRESVRSGVFTLAAGIPSRERTYRHTPGRAGLWHGGTQRVAGRTLFKHPLVVRAGQGGALAGNAFNAMYSAENGDWKVEGRRQRRQAQAAYQAHIDTREEDAAQHNQADGHPQSSAWYAKLRQLNDRVGESIREPYERLLTDIDRALGVGGLASWGVRSNLDPEQQAENLATTLEAWGVDDGTAYEKALGIAYNANQGNQARYAASELVTAYDLRRNGYDGALAYSRGFGGKVLFGEMFDVRAITYPTEAGEVEIHPQFQARAAPSAMAGSEPADLGIPGVTGSRATMTREGGPEDRIVEHNRQTILDNYSGDMGEIIVKELVQNMVDASRETPGAHSQVAIFPQERRIWAIDQGSGMPRAVVENEFTEYKSSLKPGGASGGKGTAKSAILGRSERVEVRTIGRIEIPRASPQSDIQPMAEHANSISIYHGILELYNAGQSEPFYRLDNATDDELNEILGPTITKALRASPTEFDPEYLLLYEDALIDAKQEARLGPEPEGAPEYRYEETIAWGNADDYLRPSAGLQILSGPVGWVDEAVGRGQLKDILTDPVLTAPWNQDTQQRMAQVETEIAQIETDTRPGYGRTVTQERRYQELSDELYALEQGTAGPPKTGTRISVVVEQDAPWEMPTGIAEYPSALDAWMNNFIASNQIQGQTIEFVQDGVVYAGQPIDPRKLATTFVATIEGPTWDIDIYASDHIKNDSGVQVDIQNNGLYQFYDWVSLPREIQLPSKLTANVRSKVGAKQAGYPWSGDRMRLINGTREAIVRYVNMELMGAVVAKERAATEAAIKDAAPLPGGPGKLFNVGRVDGEAKAELDDLAQRPYLAILNRYMAELHDVLESMLVGKSWTYAEGGTFVPSSFGGFGVSGSWQGLHVTILGMQTEYTTPSLLLYDPWNLLQTAAIHAVEQDMPLTEGAEDAAEPAAPSVGRALTNQSDLTFWDPMGPVMAPFTDPTTGREEGDPLTPEQLMGRLRTALRVLHEEEQAPGTHDAEMVAYRRAQLDALGPAAGWYRDRLIEYLAARLVFDDALGEIVDPYYPQVEPRTYDPDYAPGTEFGSVDQIHYQYLLMQERLERATTDEERTRLGHSMDRLQRLYDFNTAVEDRAWEHLAAVGLPEGRDAPTTRVNAMLYRIDQDGIDRMGRHRAGVVRELADRRAEDPDGDTTRDYEKQVSAYDDALERIQRTTGLVPSAAPQVSLRQVPYGEPASTTALAEAVESGLPFSDRFVAAYARTILGTSQHEHGHTAIRAHDQAFSSFLGAIISVTGTDDVRAIARRMVEELNETGGLRAMAADLEQHARIVSADNVFEKVAIEEKALDPAEWPADPRHPPAHAGAGGGLVPVVGAGPLGGDRAAAPAPGGVPEAGRGERVQPEQSVQYRGAGDGRLAEELRPVSVSPANPRLGRSPTLQAAAAESAANLHDALVAAIGDDPLLTPEDQRVIDGFARFYTSAIVGLATNDQARLDTVGLTPEDARVERERAITRLQAGPDPDAGLQALYDAEAAWASVQGPEGAAVPPPSAMAGQEPPELSEPFYSRLAQIAGDLPDVIEGTPGRVVRDKPRPERVVRQPGQNPSRQPPPANRGWTLREDGAWIEPAREASERTVEQTTPGQELMRQIREAGAKPDEIAWAGLEMWANEQGDRPIPREQVLDQLSQRRIQIKEVMLGGLGEPEVEVYEDGSPELVEDTGYGSEDEDGEEFWGADQDLEPRYRYRYGAYRRDEDDPDDWRSHRIYEAEGNDDEGFWVTDEGGAALSDEPVSSNRVTQLIKEHATEAFTEPLPEGAAGPVRFAYEPGNPNAPLVEPGGEEYRELLLMFPSLSQREAVATEQQAVYDLQAEEGRIMGRRNMAELSQDPEALRSWVIAHTQLDEANKRLNAARDRWNREHYTESHWTGYPDVFLHVRFNTRTLSDGRRMLFVEEWQSDWQQQGRDTGYRPKEGLPKGYGLERRPPSWLNPEWPIRVDSGEGFDEETGEYKNPRVLEPGTPEFDAYVDEQSEWYATTPDDTRATRFVNETDARAYLERRAEGAGLLPEMPFTRGSDAWATLGFRRMVRWAAENGYDAIGWTTGAQQNARYEGRIKSPEALPKFYDERMVAIARDLGEPWGVKPSMTDLDTGEGEDGYALMAADGRGVVKDGNDEIIETLPTYAEARAYVEAHQRELRTGHPPVHMLEIPAQMKRSALEVGQPLFMAGAEPPELDPEDMQPVWDTDPEDEIDADTWRDLDEDAVMAEIQDPEGLPRTDNPEQAAELVAPELVEPPAPGEPVLSDVPLLGPPDPTEPNLEQFPTWAQGMLELGSLVTPGSQTASTQDRAEVEDLVRSGPQAELLNEREQGILIEAILLQYARMQRAANARTEQGGMTPFRAARLADEARRFTALRRLAATSRDAWPQLDDVWSSGPVSQGTGDTLDAYIDEQRAASAAGDAEATARLERRAVRRLIDGLNEGRPRPVGRRMRRAAALGRTNDRADDQQARQYGDALADVVGSPFATPERVAASITEPDLSIGKIETLIGMRYNGMLIGARGILTDYASNSAMLFGKMLADPFLPETGGANPLARGSITVAEYAALVRTIPLAIRVMARTIFGGLSDTQSDIGGTPHMISGRLGARIANARAEGAPWYGRRMLGLRGGKLAAIGFVELAGRLKGSADEAIKILAFTTSQTRQAAIKAWREGQHPVGSRAWHARVEEIMRGQLNPNATTAEELAAARVEYEQMLRNSAREAQQVTFQGPMGSTGRLMEPFQKHPLGQFIVPFLRTLYHIRGWAIDLSPIGAAVTTGDVMRAGVHRGLMQSERGQRVLGATRNFGGLAGGPYAQAFRGAEVGPAVLDLDRRMLANMVGTLGFFYLVGLAFEGGLSGTGPPDDPVVWLEEDKPDFEKIGLRRSMEGQGWQRYSIKINGHWVSYQSWGPLAYLMAAAAAIGEGYRYGIAAGKQRSPAERSAFLPLAGAQGAWDLATSRDVQAFKSAGRRFFSVIKDISFLGGLVELADVLEKEAQLHGYRAPAGESPGERTQRMRRAEGTVNRWLTNTATTFLPVSAATRALAASQDPYARATEYGSFGEGMSLVIPELGGPIPPGLAPPWSVADWLKDPFGSTTGRRQGLPILHDVVGRPVPNTYEGWYAITPFRATTEDLSNPTVNALVDAGIGPPTAHSELYYRPTDPTTGKQGKAIMIALPQVVRQQIAETMGQRIDQRVQELLQEVSPAQRAADPDAWKDRLSTAMWQIRRAVGDEYADDPRNKSTIRRLMADPERVRWFESQADKEIFRGGAEPPTDADEPTPTSTPLPVATPRPTMTPTPRPGATPRPATTPRPAATPRPGVTPRPGTPIPGPTPTPRGPSQSERDRAKQRAGVP